MSNNEKEMDIIGTTEALLEKLLEELPAITTRQIGNSALSVGFGALCRVLKSPEESESKKEALRIAESAAAWYKAAWDRHDTLPPREQLFADPQKMESRISFLLKQEASQNEEPSEEYLAAIGVTPQEYKEVGEEENRKWKSWLTENREEIEQKWSQMVASVPYTRTVDLTSTQLGNGVQWGLASGKIAVVLLNRHWEKIRKQRIKALKNGWQDAGGEIKLLTKIEKALVVAIRKERENDENS
jgi:hypothetical protein